MKQWIAAFLVVAVLAGVGALVWWISGGPANAPAPIARTSAPAPAPAAPAPANSRLSAPAPGSASAPPAAEPGSGSAHSPQLPSGLGSAPTSPSSPPGSASAPESASAHLPQPASGLGSASTSASSAPGSASAPPAPPAAASPSASAAAPTGQTPENEPGAATRGEAKAPAEPASGKQRLIAGLDRSVIHFASGSTNLPPSAADAVTRAADEAKRLPPGYEVRIAGYTDNTGNAAANVVLSQQRADAVRQALIKAGVNPDILIAKGYGSADPIASNDTVEGQLLNRRIELQVVPPPNPAVVRSPH